MPASPKPNRKKVGKPSAQITAKPLKRSTIRKVPKKVVAKLGSAPLDLSAVPPESVTQLEKWICLACVLDVFTRHMGLAPRTAHLEITRYTPTLVELYAQAPTRRFFADGA